MQRRDLSDSMEQQRIVDEAMRKGRKAHLSVGGVLVALCYLSFFVVAIAIGRAIAR